MTSLDGIRVEVSQFLTGTKKAVLLNDVLHVSPAMLDLMQHADQEELQRLLAAIPVLNFGMFDPTRMDYLEKP